MPLRIHEISESVYNAICVLLHAEFDSIYIKMIVVTIIMIIVVTNDDRSYYCHNDDRSYYYHNDDRSYDDDRCYDIIMMIDRS